MCCGHFQPSARYCVPKHPTKGTALFNQWLIAWRQDTIKACQNAVHSIGTDASYKGQNIAMAAIIIQTQARLVYQSARPCSAHSSFDGELQALLDAVGYIASSLQGQVVIVADNEAALAAACSNAPLLGFATSLSICKLLKKWFQQSPSNQLQLR